MSLRFVVTSPTGGSGRTTLALHLAVALGSLGHRTLLVDLDPNNGVAHALGRGDRSFRGVADVLALDVAPSQVVVDTRSPNLSLLLRGKLDPIDVPQFEQLLSERGRLSSMLGLVEGAFDRVVIDVPAGVRGVVRAALAECTHTVVAVEADPRSVRALSQSLRVIESVRARENPKLSLAGLVLTRVDLKRASSQDAIGAIWEGFDCVFESTVAESEAIAKAWDRGVPVGHIGSDGDAAARRFTALAQELEAAIQPSNAAEEQQSDSTRPFF
ncbi:MAG: ParA family protein [Polyangiales bacterium]